MNETAEEVKQTEITVIDNCLSDLAEESRILRENLNDIVRRTVPSTPSDQVKQGTEPGYSDFSVDRVKQRLDDVRANLTGIRLLVNELTGIL